MRGKLFALDFVIGDNQCRLLHILPELMPLEGSSHTSRYQHHHSCFEVYYITSGQCVVGSNRKRLCVPSGQLLLIPPGIYHSANSASEDASVMTLSFELRPPDNASKKTNSNRFAQAFSLSAPIILPATGSDIEYVLSQLRDITREGNPPYIHLEKARSLCSLLLLELYELLTQTEPQLPAVPARRGLPQNYVIDIFFGHHFRKKNASPELAQMLNVSPRQLNRILKKLYGLNYREKLLESRLEIATDFLSTTDKSIAEIAELLGYSSPANFSSFVKKATGKTPSQIRKESRISADP